jgi:polyhydroxybutyrate depolymerase
MRPTLLVLAACAASGCKLDYASDCTVLPIAAGDRVSCVVPGWVDRAFDLRVPQAWDGVSELPVIVAIHGGGALRLAAELVACPGGDGNDPGCLVRMATARGYAVVMPDGTGSRPLRGVRTWNAGGGHDGFTCISGAACDRGIDDIAYIDDLFDVLGVAIPIDAARVYATGISNGGAMSHRLACEDHDRFAAIAPVAGENQHAETGGPCATQTALLDLHGTLDPAWPYDGGTNDSGFAIGVDTSMEGWRVRNGCAATFVDTPLADVDPTDLTTSARRRWDGCVQPTERIRIDGGGHTWPSGYQYFSVDRVGRITHDFGSEVILDFFDANRR